MATWEEELRQAVTEYNLLETEWEANEEESALLSLDRHPKRHKYLTLRNVYLMEAMTKLKERVKSVRHNLEWDKRTR